MSAITNHAALVDLLEFAEANGLASEGVLCAGWEYADNLARRASKRSGTKTKNQVRNENLIAALLEKAAELGPNFTGADTIARMRPLGGEWADVSAQKMTALLTMAVKAGRLAKTKNKSGHVVYTVNA